MSQVSCWYLLLLDPLADGRVELVEATAQGRVGRVLLRDDLGEAGTQDAIIDARAEQGRPPALVRHAIAMALGEPFNQAVQTQPPQVVGHLSRSDTLGLF